MSLLLLGPIKGTKTGQSICFSTYVDSIKKRNVYIVDTNYSSQNKLFRAFKNIKCILQIILFTTLIRPKKIYFTCSRNLLSSIKDLILINLSKIYGAKIFCHVHGSDFHDLYNLNGLYGHIIRKTYNKVDHLIVLTQRMHQLLAPNFPKIEIIPNFVEFDGKITEKKNPPITFLYLSNIMFSKGIFYLIDAFKELVDDYNIELLIAGNFISDSYMQEKDIKKKFLDEINGIKNISFLGYLDNPGKQEVLAKANVFVLPTFYSSEAFPMSILEALYFGNFIITTNHNSNSEIITQENGDLIQSRNLPALKKSMIEIINNESRLRKAFHLNHMYAKSFSKNRYIQSLNKLVFSDD